MLELKWTDSLSLGIESIDGQHKELLNIINQVLVSIKENQGEEIVAELLTKLREYTVFHFNAEEAFMEEILYPGRGEHQEQHFKLKQKVKGFQCARFHKELVTLYEIREMLSDWLLHHILECDLRIVSYLKEQKKEKALAKEKKQAAE
ncbi:MAG: bacteriohemerythrin [Desulfovibrionaceae bacterium]